MKTIKENPDLVKRSRNIGTVEKPFFIDDEREIPVILNDSENIKLLNLYLNTQRWGLPSGRGWANEPAWVMEILNAFMDIELEYGQGTTNNRIDSRSKRSY